MTASVTKIHTDTARLALIRVDESTDESHADVEVTVVFQGEEHRGSSVGAPADAIRPSLVAAATLDALAFLEDSYRLIDTTITEAGGARVALAVIADPEDARPLIGSAVLDDDNRQVAFAKAALDAVNRRLGRSL
jgi:hypothetical protein